MLLWNLVGGLGEVAEGARRELALLGDEGEGGSRIDEKE